MCTLFALASLLLLIPGLAMGHGLHIDILFHGVLHYVKGLAAIVLMETGFNAFPLALHSLYLKRQKQRIIKMLGQILCAGRSCQEAEAPSQQDRAISNNG